ncbi:MAG: hypothetical protein IJB97_01630, partial [Clostridia bacterium]|nr:hypothetical protein [Clostridia bacterium]
MKKTLLVLLSSLTVACAAAGAALSLPTPFAGADTNAVTTETIETIEADFSDAAHANHFEKYGTSAGWAITDGKYSPNAVWSTVNTAKKLDLTKSQQISFDVFLTSADAVKQFNVGFFETKTEETNSQPNTGLAFSFSSTVWVSTNFGRNGWAGECVKDIFNDQTHSVTISMQEKALSVTVDGEQLAFLSNGAAYTPTLTADSAYLLL